MKKFVVCQICGSEFKRLTAAHMSLHRMTVAEYRELYPDAEIVSEEQRAGQTEMLLEKHKKDWFSEEGRGAISRKLKRRHAEGKMPCGVSHWSYGKRRVHGEWVPKEDLRVILGELSAQDLTLARMAEECGVTPKTITNWLREFGLQRGIRSGERCSWWRGGHKKYRGPGWLTIRKRVLERDDYKCVECGLTQDEARERGHGLSVHHIIPYADSHDNSLDNLESLCQSCHLIEEWENGRLSTQGV